MSIKQLYKICTTYWDDDYNTTSVSPDVSTSDVTTTIFYFCLCPFTSVRHDSVDILQVILSMKALMSEENEGEMDSEKSNNTLSLHDNSRYKEIKTE